MKKKYACFITVCLLLLIVQLSNGQQAAGPGNFRLIAHRGGVVDSTVDENSMQALERAAAQQYWMVEIDVRLTKDSVLITHHDNTLKRTFGIDSAVSAMPWTEISQLRNARGYHVLSLEEVFRFCQGKMGVMIDNKIRGNDTAVWAHIIALLKKYDLYDNALMIGTEESTEYFTGKIRLSCTRRQLEDNLARADYKPANYYLFSGKMSKDDVSWARTHHILTVGVINAWPFRSAEVMAKAKLQAESLKAAGVDCFQIDSDFKPLLTR